MRLIFPFTIILTTLEEILLFRIAENIFLSLYQQLKGELVMCIAKKQKEIHETLLSQLTLQFGRHSVYSLGVNIHCQHQLMVIK